METKFKEIKYNYPFFKLPYFNRFAAMTVTPNLYVAGNKVWEQLVRHEEVHLKQQKNRWYFFFIFLPLYFIKWGIGVIKYGLNMKAYYSIDWEREAYVLASPGYLSRLGYPDLDTNPFADKS